MGLGISKFILAGQMSGAKVRATVAVLILLMLASCASSGAREAEIAAQEAAEVAAQQEAARVAEEQERQRVAEMRRQREAREAEQARLQAQRQREREEREREEQMLAEQARLAAERAERQERARQAEIAAAAAERQAKLDKISELEAQIASTQSRSSNDESSAIALGEAVVVAENLLDMLADEQAKYENTDEAGNTVEPLAKEQIAELEALKNELVGRARSQ